LGGIGFNANAIDTVSTAQSFARFQTTGGDFYIGTEGSVGGVFFPGSTAYAAVLYNASSTPMQFYTAGTLRATLDSSGNLGIGTSSPLSRVDVRGATGDIGFQYIETTTGNTNRVLLGAVSGAGYIDVTAGVGLPVLQFRTVGNTQATLDSSGNLGIGATPIAKLDVVGGDGDGIQYRTGTRSVGIGQIASEAAVYWGSTTALTFFSGSELMRLDSSGNLGIGTNNPIGRLAVVGSAVGAGVFSVDTDATRVDIQSYNKPLAINRQGNDTLLNEGGGNLGIGTSSPVSKLSIVGSVRQQNAETETNALLTSVTGSTSTIETRYGTPLIFGTNATERLRIDASGNLGLGVTPSAWALPAFESQYGLWAGRIEGNVTSNAYFNGGYNYIASGIEATRYRQLSGTHAWFISTDPTPTAGNAISFTQAMTLDGSGNLALGATSANARLDVVGGSIRVNEDSIGTKIITVRSDYAGLGPAINVTTSHPLLFLTGNTERVRIKSTGQLRFVPLAADPAGAEAGDVYYNSGTNKLRLYDGSTWVDLN
jgi:hypothetical protein